MKSPFYSTTETSQANDDITDEPIDIHTESEDECEESLLMSSEPTSVNFIITRKNQKRFSGAEQKVHTASQTEFVPINILLRIESSSGSGVFAKIKPEYHEVMTLMMSKFQCNGSSQSCSYSRYRNLETNSSFTPSIR